jgi:hypothetical protein
LHIIIFIDHLGSKSKSQKKQKYDKNGKPINKSNDRLNKREDEYSSLDRNSDPESNRSYSVIETITEEYESDDSQGNKIMKKRHVEVRKTYKTVNGKLVEKVRGRRKVKKRRKDSQGNSVEYTTDESYTEGERSVDEDKLDQVNKSIRKNIRDQSCQDMTYISARVNKKYDEDDKGYNSFVDPNEYNTEMKNILNKDGANNRTFKNGFKQRLNSTNKQEDYFFDPKTGRKVRYSDTAFELQSRDKIKSKFADNHVPHDEN